jgi:hypothetical protein
VWVCIDLTAEPKLRVWKEIKAGNLDASLFTVKQVGSVGSDGSGGQEGAASDV